MDRIVDSNNDSYRSSIAIFVWGWVGLVRQDKKQKRGKKFW